MGWYDKDEYFVYLAGVPGKEMKIGYTWSLKYRLRRLASGRPELKLIGFLRKTSRWEAHKTEQSLHREFERVKKLSEWHPWNPAITEHFAAQGALCI